uniref:Uncharacterized protein n=1 Tax=Emiliania huxleyi TaxID=2903 RepID=A0A6U8V4K1_EMIHU|mmetsp:Transcript_22029/g.64601  ORF Transcript_22029/g.64601 Transcript_22029/m.64601 type:complete len:123 (-) Transcript_22029:52-420(-)
MRLVVLLAALCSAEALTHGIVAPRSAARASPPPLAAAKDRPQPPKPSLDLQPAGDAVSDAIAPLLTLEDKGDGFDDVRGALRERQKAWRAFSDSLDRSPAARWAKVLGGEAAALARGATKKD